MLQLSRFHNLPTPDGIRQAIIKSAWNFLVPETTEISISHGDFNEPLQIAYHDGSIETIPEVSNAFVFSSEPDGLYYLYKEPSGFGKSRFPPQYRSDGLFPFPGNTNVNWDLPLISKMTSNQMLGLEVSVSSEIAPNYGWKLLDRSTGTWLTPANTFVGGIDLFHANYLTVGGYSIKNYSSSVRRDPTAWTVADRDSGRIIDSRSGITWSGAGQTQQFTLPEPFLGKGLYFDFSSSVSVGGGTQFGLSEIQLFPPLSPQSDWIYSVPDAIGRGSDGNERKRVYLGTVTLFGAEIYEVNSFGTKSSFGKISIFEDSLSFFNHRIGVPREFLSVEVDFPLGASGKIVSIDEYTVVFQSDIAGLATIITRRTF